MASRSYLVRLGGGTQGTGGGVAWEEEEEEIVKWKGRGQKAKRRNGDRNQGEEEDI